MNVTFITQNRDRLRQEVFLFFGLFLFVCSAHSESDLFESDRVMYDQKIDRGEYRLTLGSLKKVNSNWVAAKEKILKGSIERKTIEVTSLYSLGRTWQAITDYYASVSGSELFSCAELDCGSSNAWANERLGVKQLYGLDSLQNYGVWEVNRRSVTDGINQQVFYVAYAVQRGNHRIYVQLDKIIPINPISIIPSEKVIQAQLLSLGYFVLPGLQWSTDSFAIEEELVDSIVNILRKKRTMVLYVVGHDSAVGDLETQNQRALKYAETFKEIIVAKGIKSERLTAQTAGALAPESKSGLKNIVLVVQ